MKKLIILSAMAAFVCAFTGSNKAEASVKPTMDSLTFYRINTLLNYHQIKFHLKKSK